jgi:hypothetical protein
VNAFIILFILIAFASGTQAYGEDSLDHSTWSNWQSLPPASVMFPASEAGPLSERARGMSVMIGDDLDCEFFAAVDASVTAGEFDLFYFDSNQDGTFSDSERSPLKKSEKQWKSEIQSLEIGYFDGSTANVQLQFNVCHPKRGPRFQWRLARADHTRLIWPEHPDVTAILHDGRTKSGTPNGCFNDFGSDSLWIDIDKNGSFDEEERMLLTKTVRIADTFWDVATDASGHSVTLTQSQADIASGTIHYRFATPPAKMSGRLVLKSRQYRMSSNLQVTNQIHAPAGQYRIKTFQITCTDSSNQTWTASLNSLKPLVIKQGQDTQMELGAPIQAEIKVADRIARGKKLSVSLKLYDTSKARYRSFNKGKIVSPQITITGPDGGILATGKMGYG